MDTNNMENNKARPELTAKERHAAAQAQASARAGSESESMAMPEESVGDIRVADEVIRIVAGLAAQEVPGVLSMSGGLTEGISRMLGKDNASKGVRIKFSGNLVQASIFLNMEYGYCIPEVALAVQEKVKESIESMTGYMVQSVDVHVEGVGRVKHADLDAIGGAEIIGSEEAHMEETFASAAAAAEDDDADLDEETAKRHAMFFEEE